jgi:DNA mismatch repair protein MutS
MRCTRRPACGELLQRALAAEPAALVRDGGVIADGFDAELDELRAIQTNCDSVFAGPGSTRTRAAPALPTCGCSSTRCMAFTSKSRKARLDKVPDDYRRRQTLKNAERFITPELKAFEDKALSARRSGALAREKWLYEQLLDALQAHVPALAALATRAGHAGRAVRA